MFIADFIHNTCIISSIKQTTICTAYAELAVTKCTLPQISFIRSIDSRSHIQGMLISLNYSNPILLTFAAYAFARRVKKKGNLTRVYSMKKNCYTKVYLPDGRKIDG